MTKPTNAVKDRWNAKNYDDIRVRVPKGRKDDIEAYATQHGKSVNGLINGFLQEMLGLTEEEWKRAADEQGTHKAPPAHPISHSLIRCSACKLTVQRRLDDGKQGQK